MIKRTLYIASPVYISTDKEQLVISNKQSGTVESVPIEDIGIIELDSQQIVITNYSLSKLASNGATVVVCNETHHPVGLYLPFESNNIQTLRIKFQIEAKKPLIKNLWRDIIIAKIKNQYLLFKKLGKNFQPLKIKMEKVKSGDSTNQEGAAAQYYWKNLFTNTPPGTLLHTPSGLDAEEIKFPQRPFGALKNGAVEFKRSREGTYPNNLLNYGYAIVRAIAARALVAAGLHPSIGLHHKNRFNPFCLADDIMEPYRIFVDEMVVNYFNENPEPIELDREIKKYLLGVSYIDVLLENKTHPLFIAIQKTCTSLAQCFTGEAKKLLLPYLTPAFNKREIEKEIHQTHFAMIEENEEK